MRSRHRTVEDGSDSAGLLDRLFERLYRRTRRRYLEALLGITAAWSLLVVVPCYSALGAIFFELDRQQWIELMVGVDLGVALGAPGVILLVYRRHAPAVRWLRGEPGPDTAAVLSSTVIALPGSVFRGVAWLTLWTIPAAVYSASQIDLSVAALVAWVFNNALFNAGAGLFLYLMFERALRPPLREQSTALSPDFEPPAGGLSLRTKLLVILLLLSVFSGIFVGAITISSTDSLSHDERIAVWILTAVGFTVTVALALSMLVRESVLTRVEALRRAMGRVDRGEYDARVLPFGGDELDELGYSFNQMVDRLRRHDEELRESRARIVAASDAGRRQVERDLHDGAQQQLVTLRLRLGMARQAVDTDPRQAAAMLDEARIDLSRALEELRDLAHGIYPAVLTADGLAAALEVAAERCPLPVTVDCDGTHGRLAPDVEAAVYFCCVEALQNAAKHAGPTATVLISLARDSGSLGFEVRDDGIGYDPTKLGMSAGMRNMADRIGALGGTLRVESTPGSGTRVIGSLVCDLSQGAPGGT